VTIYRLNPLTDPRWARLVERHPNASVFHTPSWLEALRRTYGFTPTAITTSAPDIELENGIVFCEVRSWLTGRRLVSLPFSDHCDPLVDHDEQLPALCAHLELERKREGWRYIELRPQGIRPPSQSGLSRSDEFCLHMLDLRPGPEALFRSFHKDSTQRKIRRAERERLSYLDGRTEELLHAFYELLLLTRRRHQLPPQPFAWFCHLADSMGSAMKVRVARHGDHPVAGMVTLRHRDMTVYKYGASDARYHNLGGMHLLFWRTIQEAHGEGCVTLDLGRSELDGEGLLTFKDRWGAPRSTLTYWRNPAPVAKTHAVPAWLVHYARQAFSRVPDGFRVAAGKLLYRHVG
jgi:CelD/BcsL family acetyltransferase involved in cellulose biosynthesis